MLEVTVAAVHTLLDNNTTISKEPVLTTVAIPAPMMLPLSFQDRQMQTLCRTVHVVASVIGGIFSMESAGAAASHRTVHMRGSIAQLVQAESSARSAALGTYCQVPLLLAGHVRSGAVHGPVGLVSGHTQRDSAFQCHPAAVDSSMHLAVYLGQADDRTRVPGGPAL